jgi:hypothetical protein
LSLPDALFLRFSISSHCTHLSFIILAFFLHRSLPHPIFFSPFLQSSPQHSQHMSRPMGQADSVCGEQTRGCGQREKSPGRQPGTGWTQAAPARPSCQRELKAATSTAQNESGQVC